MDMALLEKERDKVKNLRREVSVLKGTNGKLQKDLKRERGRTSQALEKQKEAEATRDKLVEEEVARRLAEVKSEALTEYLGSSNFEEEIQSQIAASKDSDASRVFVADDVAAFKASYTMCHVFLMAISSMKAKGVTETVKTMGLDSKSLPDRLAKFHDSDANTRALQLATKFGINIQAQPPPGFFDQLGAGDEEDDSSSDSSGGGDGLEEESTRVVEDLLTTPS